MASVRACTTNLIESLAMTLQNGGGGGAPALDEVSPWVTSNAQNRDRGMVWQGTATGNVDLTVPGAVGVTADFTVFAVLGHRGAPSSAVGVASVEVFTQTGAYAPAGTWTSRGTITLGSGVRDGVLIVGSVTCKSVRFAVTATTAFTIGRLWAGVVGTDIGIVSSPGLLRRRIKPRLESRMADGMPFLTLSGDPRYEFTLPYVDVGETLFDLVQAVGIQSRTFLLLDRESVPFECIIRGGTFADVLKFDAPDLQDTSLELESLP